MDNQMVATNQNGNAVANVMPSASDFMVGLQELKNRANMVTQIKSQIMRQDVHFGVIPGCGNKPTLLKNGAELLCMAFKLASDAKVEIADLGNGHREYTVTTTLSSIGTGELIATGLGSCSTMESKYRYRGNEDVNTGRAVPKDYWNAKKNGDNEEMKRLLGGSGFKAKKDENGNWMIFQRGDKKLENPDIADVYNTVLKMASKRSLIDAVLKATGGSCEFTQDIEDNPQAYRASGFTEYTDVETQTPSSAKQTQAAAPTVHHSKGSAFAQEINAMKALDPKAFDVVKAKMKDRGWLKPSDVPESEYQTVKDWFNSQLENQEL